MPTLLIIDGHSIAFRAYHSFPDSFRDPQGESVQVVYGFLSILFKQIADLQPEMVAIAFDEGRPQREEWFPDYKAGRQDIDPNVQEQVLRLYPVLEALDIPLFLVDGYEADDIIATLARQATEDESFHTIILTGDRDLFGVIGPRTTVLYPTRSMSEAERYDAARLHARWGIEPAQVADFKALVGDPSDNIPGVRGIGEKGATALLQRFGTLEAIYDNLDTVTPPRARNALQQGRDNAFLSQRLARLDDHVPGVTLDAAACCIEYDRAKVEAAFDAFGFSGLRNRLP
jgi:DNA polymerase-1